MNADGSFSYTPTYHFTGTDSFVYRATDGIASSPTATVTISVVNVGPNASNDQYMAVFRTELVVQPPGVLANDTDMEGDPFTAIKVSDPSHGTLTLNTDGSFRYMPAGDYLGGDQFTYKANDGISDGNVATVSISVVRPVPDIDGDSDNSGSIERTPDEEGEEMNAPGYVIPNNVDDDNGNGAEDRNDPGPFVDANNQPVTDDELFLVTMSVPSMSGVNLTNCTLTLVPSANVLLWKTRDKQVLPATYRIGVDQIPSDIFVEGTGYGQTQVDWVLKNPAGVEISRDTIALTVAWNEMTAYRPQNPPLPRTEIPDNQEAVPGAGIRRNGDNDNDNLIEVQLTMQPNPSPGIVYCMRRANQNIKVWAASNRTGDLFLGSNEVTITNGGVVWVEWATMDLNQTVGTLETYIWDTTHQRTVAWSTDTVNFHPYNSIVFAFGGGTTEPPDPGSGPYQMAETLYQEGYDVHEYNHAASAGAAANEAVNAIGLRGQVFVGIFGHSRGGAATLELADTLGAMGGNTIRFTAYIDAIQKESLCAVTVGPAQSQYHVNYYQGRDIRLWGVAVTPAVFNLDVNTTAWGAALNHTSIDGDATVQARILGGSGAAAPEKPHAGLRQRMPLW